MDVDFEESFACAGDFDGLVQAEQAPGMAESATTSNPPQTVTNRRVRKTGKKSASRDEVDVQAKLERRRQCAKDCRARKKIRYQYLEDLVADREKAVLALRKELKKYVMWCAEIDEGRMPDGLSELIEEMNVIERECASLFPSVD